VSSVRPGTIDTVFCHIDLELEERTILRTPDLEHLEVPNQYCARLVKITPQSKLLTVEWIVPLRA
jgi:hypothetical protein